jgi:LacI family transcriptional regulator
MVDPTVPACEVRVDPCWRCLPSDDRCAGDPGTGGGCLGRYIAEHACEGLTVDALLPHVGASRSQLDRKFRRYLGRSPQGEIRRVQIVRIRQLLAETDLPLKRIAELTGFEYMEYMCVVTRRLTGETMVAYRRQRGQAGSGGERAYERVA